MELNFPILSCLILIPLLTSALIPLIPAKDRSDQELAKICEKFAYFSSIISLVLAILLFFFGFQPQIKTLQFVENYPWFGELSSFRLGLDGLSLSMVFLTALLLPLTIAASRQVASKTKPKLYYSLLFLLSAAVLGVFLIQDLVLFFIFWELELLPMYLLIAIWGGESRLKAASKFLIYTFAGGAFLLAGIILLFWLTGGSTFSMVEVADQFRFLQNSGNLASQANLVNMVFLLFIIGFCIKLPSIPLHTWLPEAHVEAPTPISMFLAGVLLKMGAYGLIRFGAEFFPNSLVVFAPWLALLGAINILGAAIFSLVQTDMKKVIAYSSISHMGFILLGLASLSEAGLNGAIFQMFSHGLISAGLFMAIGVIYARAHTRQIDQLGGLAINMPCLFFLFLGLAMANLGLPALSGFVGESLVFYGAFTSANPLPMVELSATVSTVGVIITAGYMLWLTKRVFYGPQKEQWADLQDVKLSEKLVLLTLLLGSLVLGIYPRFLSNYIEPGAALVAQNFTKHNAE